MEAIEFLGFGLHAWITIVTVLTSFSVLLFTKLRSDLVFLAVVGVLFVTGVLNVNEALSGFSSTTVAAMIVPIMYSAAIQLGYDPLPFLIALIMAANSSLATPVGSSVNMLVYGPGGYRFGDFLRIGIPVKIAFLAVSILIVIIVYPLTPLHSL